MSSHSGIAYRVAPVDDLFLYLISQFGQACWGFGQCSGRFNWAGQGISQPVRVKVAPNAPIRAVPLTTLKRSDHLPFAETPDLVVDYVVDPNGMARPIRMRVPLSRDLATAVAHQNRFKCFPGRLKS